MDFSAATNRTPVTEFLHVGAKDINHWYGEDDKDLLNLTLIQETLREDGLSLLTPSMVFICVLIAAGIPGNVISILVYGIQLRSATGRYAIIALAACDIINCCLSIPVEIYVMTTYWSFDNAALCKMSRYLTYAMNNSSGLILLAIACERYRTICTPHKPKIQNSFILKSCVVLIIIGMLLALPALWIYGIQTDKHNVSISDELHSVVHDTIIFEHGGLGANTYVDTGRTYYSGVVTKRCLIDDPMRKSWFTYSHFLFLSIASILVWFVLIVIYAKIGMKIKRLQSGRGSITDEERIRSSAKRKKHATMMLFLITMAFQFSFIPFIIITNIRFFTEPSWYNNLTRGQKMVYHFFLRSYYLNCAVNPFIYCVSSSMFRSAVMKLFTRLRKHCMETVCRRNPS